MADCGDRKPAFLPFSMFFFLGFSIYLFVALHMHFSSHKYTSLLIVLLSGLVLVLNLAWKRRLPADQVASAPTNRARRRTIDQTAQCVFIADQRSMFFFLQVQFKI